MDIFEFDQLKREDQETYELFLAKKAMHALSVDGDGFPAEVEKIKGLFFADGDHQPEGIADLAKHLQQLRELAKAKKPATYIHSDRYLVEDAFLDTLRDHGMHMPLNYFNPESFDPPPVFY